VGLIVRDNVETGNLTRSAEDYFLFASTGGEWARVGAGRAEERPIVAVTTLEGIGRRPELNRRLICFEFQHEPGRWPEEKIRADIDIHRGVMFRGIAEVLRSMMAQSPPPTPPSIPMPDFTDYGILVYRLLRAWEEVSGKPPGFADTVLKAWDAQQCTDEAKDSAGPYPRLLEELIERRDNNTLDTIAKINLTRSDDTCKGSKGRLFTATPTAWLTALKAVANRERDLGLPATPEGLRKRLKELKPQHGYLLVTEEDDKATLARSGARRLWGILEIDDGPGGAGDG
jgi:hypothetical protein